MLTQFLPATSGAYPYKLHQLIATLAIVLVCISCYEQSLYGGKYMLRQAAGAELGMTFSQIEKIRPNAFRDSYSVWEKVDSSKSNTYIMGSKPGDTNGNSTSGRVYAVLMEQDFLTSDTTNYKSAVVNIIKQWSVQAGPPTDSSITYIDRSGPPIKKKALIWDVQKIKLAIIYDADLSQNYGVERFFRAVVQDQNVPLSETGIK